MMDSPLTHYKQTRGGNYDSRPQLVDVLTTLNGNHASGYAWEIAAADRGHGEYIDNVYAFVGALRANQGRAQALPFDVTEDIQTEAIREMLAYLQPVE